MMNMDYNILLILKKSLAIGVYVAVLQQLSGVTYVMAFGLYPDRCQELNNNGEGFEVFWTLLQCFSTFLLVITNAKSCPTLIKRSNRRRVLFQQGTIVSGICIFIIICLLPPLNSESIHIRGIQIVLCLFMINYGWTLGPTTWIYLS